MKALVVYAGPYPSLDAGLYIEKLLTKYAFCHVSVGDIIRYHIHYQTELGKQIQAIANAGELLPGELVDQAVKQKLIQLPFSTPVLLEKYPRPVKQANTVEQHVVLRCGL